VSSGGSAVTTYSAKAWTAVTGGSTVGSGCTTTGALTCTITGLTGGSTVYVDVTATNAAGMGPASSPRSSALVTSAGSKISR